MPFEYTPYRSPYAGAIADLIGRQGDLAAERALADAKARTATVGAITNSLANIAQYRADAPKRELQQMQLAEARQRMADAAEARTAGSTLGQLVSNPEYRDGFQPQGATPEGDLLPKGPSLVADMGNGLKLLDKNAIAQQMAQAGHGDWFLKNSNLIDDLNKSKQDINAMKQAHIQKMVQAYLTSPVKLETAQALVDAFGDVLPQDKLENLQKQIGVGDLRGLEAEMIPYLPQPKQLVGKVGDVVATQDPFTQKWTTEQIGGPVPSKIDARPGMYNVPGYDKPIVLNQDQFGNFYIGKTPLTQAQIEGMSEAKDMPLDKELASLYEQKQNGTLTPEGQNRLNAITGSKLLVPQFNITNRQEPLVRVRYFDPELGRTVEEFVPRSEAAGKTRLAPLSGAEQTRYDSAATLVDVGNDLIASLKDPAFVKNIGPVLGRFNTVREFIGNAPPEFAKLAGEIDSFSYANMGVHGMRNVTAANQVRELLDQRHTPESLAATIEGILKFSRSFTERMGGGVEPGNANPSQPPAGAKVRVFNPKTGKLE